LCVHRLLSLELKSSYLQQEGGAGSSNGFLAGERQEVEERITKLMTSLISRGDHLVKRS